MSEMGWLVESKCLDHSSYRLLLRCQCLLLSLLITVQQLVCTRLVSCNCA